MYRCRTGPCNARRVAHNFDCLVPSASSAFTHSLSSRLRIFPLGFFGMAPTNRTPPSSLLYLDSLSATQAFTSSSVKALFAAFTIYALGSSPSGPLTGIPMTAASRMSGCDKSTPSISGGAT